MAEPKDVKTLAEFLAVLKKEIEPLHIKRTVGAQPVITASNRHITVTALEKGTIVKVTENDSKKETSYRKDNQPLFAIITKRNREILNEFLCSQVETMSSIDFVDQNNVKFTSKEGVGRIVISSSKENKNLHCVLKTLEIYLNNEKINEYHLTEAELDAFQNRLVSRCAYLVEKMKNNLGFGIPSHGNGR